MRTLIALAGAVAGALAAGAASLPAQPPAAAPDRFVGTWQGPLDVGAMRLRLGLEVVRDAGGLRGALTSIDQGGQKFPATVTVRGDSLLLDVPAIGGAYAAVITATGDSLRGTFRQGGGALSLAMARVAALAGVRRPQEPTPPFPYRTEEVSFESAPGVRLAGTVSLPAGTGPFPAVVFSTGSGPQDRDETLLGHKPFLVLADRLARAGIASLRVDDRGVARSTGSFATATSADFATDVEAGVRFLRARPDVARDRVGIIGHSEGGLIAPMVAARSRDVAFVVLLAGPGLPGDSILVLQTGAILAASGVDSANAAGTLRFNRRVYAAARAPGDSAAVAARVRTLAEEYHATLPEAVRARTPVAALTQQSLGVTSPWMRYFLAYDPRPALRQVKVPVLAIIGTLDLQVPYRENLPAIEAALKAGGNRDARTVALPGLNHLFQTATTGSPSEYGTIEQTIAPAALDLVTSWITERFVRR